MLVDDAELDAGLRYCVVAALVMPALLAAFTLDPDDCLVAVVALVAEAVLPCAVPPERTALLVEMLPVLKLPVLLAVFLPTLLEPDATEPLCSILALSP